jgi:hypothetical protein
MALLANFRGDFRNYCFNRAMDTMLVGIGVIAITVSKAIYNAYKAQPIPWTVLIIIAFVGLSLVAFSTVALRKKNKDSEKDSKRVVSDRGLNIAPTSATGGEVTRESCFEGTAHLLKTREKYLDAFNALFLARADNLDSNEDVIWVCKQLALREYEHPFSAIHMFVPDGEWLQFLKWGRHHAKYNFESDNDYLYAAEEWNKKSGRAPVPDDVQVEYETYRSLRKRME